MAASPAPSLDHPRGQRAWEWLWPTLSGAQREGVELILQPSRQEEAGDAVGLALAFLRMPGIEGCKLEAYPDPETGGDPWTIGWGNTRIDGRSVRKGDRITQARADALLGDTVKALVLVLEQEVPSWGLMGSLQRAALLSFAFNNGAWFMRSGRHQTIERALREGRLLDVPEAMKLYVNPGGPTEEGLRKRRRLEADMWMGEWIPSAGTLKEAPAPSRPVQPAAPAVREPQLYLQTDSRVAGQAPRSCFSSACAMLLKRVKPQALQGNNADDDYLRVVLRYGDTTEAGAQIAALRTYGVHARLVTTGSWTLLEQQCRRGFGAAVGYIHNGSLDGLRGTGHWAYAWGFDSTHLTVHDPMGEADMVAGGFVAGRSGRAVRYSRRNFSRRWEVAGPPWRHAPGHGWMVVVDGVSG